MSNNALIYKRHIVTAWTAKTHEYQASLVQRLDEIAKRITEIMYYVGRNKMLLK